MCVVVTLGSYRAKQWHYFQYTEAGLLLKDE